MDAIGEARFILGSTWTADQNIRKRYGIYCVLIISRMQTNRTDPSNSPRMEYLPLPVCILTGSRAYRTPSRRRSGDYSLLNSRCAQKKNQITSCTFCIIFARLVLCHGFLGAESCGHLWFIPAAIIAASDDDTAVLPPRTGPMRYSSNGSDRSSLTPRIIKDAREKTLRCRIIQESPIRGLAHLIVVVLGFLWIERGECSSKGTSIHGGAQEA
ncbi:hypothetical protein AB1N83_004504 [Pleurotus pulmonarius]